MKLIDATWAGTTWSNWFVSSSRHCSLMLNSVFIADRVCVLFLFFLIWNGNLASDTFWNIIKSGRIFFTAALWRWIVFSFRIIELVYFQVYFPNRQTPDSHWKCLCCVTAMPWLHFVSCRNLDSHWERFRSIATSSVRLRHSHNLLCGNRRGQAPK